MFQGLCAPCIVGREQEPDEIETREPDGAGPVQEHEEEEWVLHGKVRMLCLHGRGSNSEVTRLQVENLGLLRAELELDVAYLNGPIEAQWNGPEEVRGSIPGPFYSWVADPTRQEEVQSAVEMVADAAADVDVIYGFSQGAAVAIAAAERLAACGKSVACLCVCAAGLEILAALGYSAERRSSATGFFVVGTRDSYKPQSEAVASCLHDAQVLYFDISEHGVPRTVKADADGCERVARWCLSAGGRRDPGAALPSTGLPAARDTEGATAVQLAGPGPWWGGEGATILQTLRRRRAASPAVHGAGLESATYGALVEFLRGPGDLRRWGAGPEAVVAYVMEEGPSAAVLALSVASQCAAAPLSASASPQELAASVELLKPHTLIASEGQLEKARGAAAEAPGVQLLLAKPTGAFAGCLDLARPAPGPAAPVGGIPQDLPAGGLALLLMTSGTTSKPKVVPLRMGAIVANGAAIAKSLELTEGDVCINALALFHIAGIAASLLATVASGGSVLCMSGFQPEAFISALGEAPRPTWFSAVPTMHLALMRCLQERPVRPRHTLRFVRSGAASLDPSLARGLRELWGCRLLPTYSMTEQMPIAQPPHDYELDRPGAVGVPMVAAAVVDGSLRPVPFGVPGEICISGPTVMTGYRGDAEANAQSFFLLGGERYFRTGDVGSLDEGGYLYVTGRSKELIKCGAEQVNPKEVEEVLSAHANVEVAVVFGVPDEVRGEVPGAAVVLKGGRAGADVATELRALCAQRGLAPYKVPRFHFVGPDDLPKTATGKYSRRALAEKLGQQATAGQGGAGGTGGGPGGGGGGGSSAAGTAGLLSEATVGFRFILSVMVAFNHIGDHAWPWEDQVPSSHSNWARVVTSYRTMGDISVVCFSILAGMSLTVSTAGAPVERGQYLRFCERRLVPIHLIYLVACALCILNRLIACPPSSFADYEYGSQDGCMGTALGLGYGGTWVMSLLVLTFTLQAWPFATVVWHLCYYTWFSSAYVFCVAAYPLIHRCLHDKAGRGPWVLAKANLVLHGVHYLTLVFLFAVYFGWLRDEPEEGNYFLWAGYMFPPFWAIRFACGCLLGFTLLHHRPAEKEHAWVWGLVVDGLTLAWIVAYIVLISLGVEVEHKMSDHSDMEARVFCAQIPRFGTPVLCIYLYGLAVGKGLVAHVCRHRVLVQTLAPASYGIYLLHQPVFEWVSAAKWNGDWWTQRKRFMWFSPDPVAFEWWESIVAVLLTALFSMLCNWLIDQYLMVRWLALVRWATGRRQTAEKGSVQLVVAAVEEVSGLAVDADTRLADCGLASLGVTMLISQIRGMDSSVRLSVVEVLGCGTVRELADLIDAPRLRGGDLQMSGV